MPQPSKPVEPLSAEEMAAFEEQVKLLNDPHYPWTHLDTVNLVVMLPRVVATRAALRSLDPPDLGPSDPASERQEVARHH